MKQKRLNDPKNWTGAKDYQGYGLPSYNRETSLYRCPKCDGNHAHPTPCPHCGYNTHREALPNNNGSDLAEPTDANPTPLPVKPTISFDEESFNQLLAQAEQRGYQKGREEQVMQDFLSLTVEDIAEENFLISWRNQQLEALKEKP